MTNHIIYNCIYKSRNNLSEKLNTTPRPVLDTGNPDHLTYESGMLQIAILGGIRLEDLDRMRTRLKADDYD